MLEYTGPGAVLASRSTWATKRRTSRSRGDLPVRLSDSILQMWAAFLYELDTGRTPSRFAGCVTPWESVAWHMLFTAALESQTSGVTAKVLD